jgi:hypothetical protein
LGIAREYLPHHPREAGIYEEYDGLPLELLLNFRFQNLVDQNLVLQTSYKVLRASLVGLLIMVGIGFNQVKVFNVLVSILPFEYHLGIFQRW